MNKSKSAALVMCIASVLLVNSCGSEGDDIADIAPINTPVDMGNLDPSDAVPIDASQSDMFQQANASAIGDVTMADSTDLNGVLIPAIFETQTDVDLAYAQSAAALIGLLNESLLLPENINVAFADCGVANAFYIPAQIGAVSTPPVAGDIVMCHELTALFANFYGNNEQAFLTSTFVLMHELGHALVDVLELPVLGIEESYVDGIAAVLLGESGLSQGSVLAGWFFGSQQGTPFFDSHRAGPQRLGDLACWGVGADTSLLDDPITRSLATQLFQSGRDCVREYQQQLNGFSDVLGPSIRGGLNVLVDPATE